MISGILVNIMGYTLFISFILFLLGASIYLIIDGTQEYLEKTNWCFLFEIILGCICIMVTAILVLKAFGL